MKKKEQIKIIKKSKDKKKINWLIIQIGILIILVFLIITSSFFSAKNFFYSYKMGIAYSGGYQVQVDVFKKNDSNFSYDTPNGDNKKGLEILKNKLDPLSNQNLYLQTLGHNSVEIIVGKDVFVSYDELSKIIQQLGSIYLTDNKGRDLLINNNNEIKERIPLNNVISGSTISIDKYRRLIITLQIKNHKKWNNIINDLKSLEEKNTNNKNYIYIWTDIGKMVDNLRHDIDMMKIISTLFNIDIHNQVSSNEWTNIYNIFNVEYYNSGNSQINYGNLLDLILNYPTSQIKVWMKDSNFRFTTVPTKNLLIDPNDKFDVTNQYIDPLRPFLQKIIEYNVILTKTYRKHIINWNSIKNINNIAENSNEIIVSTETEARQINNLINGGLSGLEFIIRGYRDIKPIISVDMFKILFIILIITILIIFIILIIYYRLFGIITVFNLLFTIITTLYFSSLLKVKISPENISALIILFVLLLEINLIFFSCYKHEIYKNNINSEQAIKIANKKIINIFIEFSIVLMILGLSLFWLGTNNIKSFAIILLIGLFMIIIVNFIVIKLIYLIIIKLRLYEKYSWLDISKFSFITFLLKKQSIKKFVKEKIINYLFFIKKSNKKLNFINNSNKNNLELSNSIVIKNKKNEQSKYKKINFYISKLIIIISVILFLISLIIFFVGKTNVSNTFKSGINISINEELWKTTTDELKKEEEVEKIAIFKLKNYLKKFKKTTNYNFNFDIYIIKKQENNIKNNFLVVSTNITKGTFEYKLLETISLFYNSNSTDPSILLQRTNPIMVNYTIKIIVISIIISLIFIFIYMLFISNWSQFISTIIFSIFTLFITISIVIISHLLITFEMIIAFLIIFCFSILFENIIFSLIKQNKKIININNNNKEFFTYILKNIIKIKYLRNYHNIFYKKELKKIQIKNPYLKLKKIKKEYKKQFNYIKLLTKDIKNNNYKLIKKIKKENRIYSYEYNFLQKIINFIFKEIFQYCLILCLIFMSLFIVLLIFSGSFFGFNIIILIGLIVGIFLTLFFAIPFWILLEKYRFLNKIRIKNYLDSYFIRVDEQIIFGINN